MGEMKKKQLTMPMDKSMLSPKSNGKAFSKRSSQLDATTVSSSTTARDRYAEPAEKLEWAEREPISDKHVKMYDCCNKFDKDKAKTHFDYIASNYEGMYLRMGYPDPKFVAKFVHKLAKKNQQKPADVKVLDLGCGTGLIGKYLAPQGFKNIVGVDISPNMLEEASVKGVYSELHEHCLGDDPDQFPQQFKNQFDYVTCAGLINNNHMEYTLFEEMLLSVKKGGYCVFAARFSYMGLYWYDKIIKEMEDNSRWKLIATDTFFKYDKLECVSVGRFSRTPSKVFVF